MTQSGLRGLGAAQLLLSSTIAFATITLVVLGLVKKAKAYKENKEAKKASMAGEGSGKQQSSGYTINVQAGIPNGDNDTADAAPDG